MSGFSLLSPHRYIKVFNWVGAPLILLYIASMFFIPFITTGGDWKHIQNIWDRWQSLNVGMLAFVSSLVAFNISRYNAEQQRTRDFVAARSFLPESLSELTSYCKESMEVFAEAWRRASDHGDRCNTPLEIKRPYLPESYRGVFSKCISLADSEVGDRLSYILMLLQVHHARLNGLFDMFQNNESVVMPENIISYFYRIAEIQALINKTFDFARGLEDFDGGDLVWEDYRSALGANDIWVSDFDRLQGFIERAIERGNQQR